MSAFDIAPRSLNTSSSRYHNSDSGGFKVSSSRNPINSEASLGIPELFPNTRRYVQWLFEQGIITDWRYYHSKIAYVLNVAPIEYFSPEILRREGSKKRTESLTTEKTRTSSVSDSSALLRAGSDKKKNSTSAGTLLKTNSEKRGTKKQSRSTGENTTFTMTMLSERKQHRKQVALPKTSKNDDEEDDVFTKKETLTKTEKLERWV